MKFITILALTAAATGAAFAGTVSFDPNQPTYSPSAAFSNQSVTVSSSGSVASVKGGGTILGTPGTTATISAAGSFTANSGESLSGAYSFNVDNQTGAIINYTVKGTAFGQSFSSSGTADKGKQTISGPINPKGVPFGISGQFVGSVSFTFNTPTAADRQESAANAVPSAAAGSMDFKLEQVDFGFQTAAVAPIAASQPLNISTRLAVQTGENVLIGGFIIAGADPKKVIVRGLGPSLQAGGQPLAGAVADPFLELHDATTTLASNNDWKTTQQAEITATGIPPKSDFESAIVQTLPANNATYTAVLKGNNNSAGIALLELYDLAQSANARLANISTRGFVDTGNNVMIGGFILGPNTNSSTKVLVRGIGPSLTAAGVAGALQDPVLELHDGNGTTLQTNDNWATGPDQAQINSLGLAPKDPRESAVLAIAAPGNYTAVLSGAASSKGVGLIEIYHLP